MKKNQLVLLALLLMGIFISTNALAHGSVGFSFNIGQPYYYAPPAVYYAPPPVVYYDQGPIYREYYRAPPAVYYAPRASRYYYDDDWRGYYKHHRHHDDH